MKKLLLGATAIAGFAFTAAPAHADGLSVDLGGFYRGYAVYADLDQDAAAASVRDFDLRHDSEIYFTGETTLDSGLTVGFHSETDLGDASGTDRQNELYAYFSGSWGRVNFGKEDGAQYLLQVAAPSTDSNVDGLRTYVQGYADPAAGVDDWDLSGTQSSRLDYDMNMAQSAQKITYLTPKFNGFQAGFTYAPELTDGEKGLNAIGAMATDEDANDFDEVLEVGARWDGEFEGVAVSFGAGYGRASNEDDSAVADDDRKQWNTAFNLGYEAFSFGAAYATDNHGQSQDRDQDTWVVGLGWDNGPYHAAVSYYDTEFETGVNTETKVDRVAVGGTYAFGPGMSFRGTVAFGDVENDTGNDNDFTQVTLGTDINF